MKNSDKEINSRCRMFDAAVFKDITPESLEKARKDMEKRGKIETIHTPFGDLDIMNHRLLKGE